MRELNNIQNDRSSHNWSRPEKQEETCWGRWGQGGPFEPSPPCTPGMHGPNRQSPLLSSGKKFTSGTCSRYAPMFTGQSGSSPAVTSDPARAPPFLGLHTDSEDDLQTEVYREHHRDSGVLVENGETSCGGQTSTPVQMELTGIKPAHKLQNRKKSDSSHR